MRQSCAMGIPLGKTVEVKASGGSAKHPAENPSLSAEIPIIYRDFFIYTLLSPHFSARKRKRNHFFICSC